MKTLRSLFLLIMLSSLQLHAQKSLSFAEFEKALQVEPKPSLIFLHTDWCKYCEAMKMESLKDERVLQLLDEHFYCVSFNGESKENTVFMGQSYKFKPTGKNTGNHELALELGTIEAKLNYPVLLVLNKEMEIIYRRSSFHSSEEILTLLESVLSEN